MTNKLRSNSPKASPWESGKLFVFEGPDGVGKSTLSQSLANHLKRSGVSVKHLSFPGRDEGTLGKLVYRLHHEPEALSVNALSPASLQALHIAAHLDAIERVILPALADGQCVVLDRYWWSTWVYGIVGGAQKDVLSAMLNLEKTQWGGVLPTAAFLINNDKSFRADEPTQHWQGLAKTYRQLADEESAKYSVHLVTNDQSPEASFKKIVEIIKEQKCEAARQGRSTPDVASSHNGDVAASRHKNSSLPQLRVSEVYDTYWKFAVERQAVFFRRLHGEPEPWTQDPILQQHKFTNAYRASDRVSQYLIRHVIYNDAQNSINDDPDDVFFRILLFKVFNRISTWKTLESELGRVNFQEYSFDRYDKVLLAAKARGERIFSSAYIMPTGVATFGYNDKHRNFLQLIERMIEDGVPWRLTELKTMREAFELLRSYPLMGDFLAYQYVIDLNYSTLTDFSENEFVVPGPGARDGIAKCFRNANGISEADVIRRVTERQQQEFERLGLQFQDLWGRSLQLIDCQNLFCEVDKYARLAHPDVKGLSGLTRIKQKFQPIVDEVAYWYPPKWGINKRVSLELKRRKASTPAAPNKAPSLPFH